MMNCSGGKVTLLIVTHYSPYNDYGELAPPSSGIVKRTLESIDSQLFSLDSDLLTQSILVYNEPLNSESEDQLRYKKNLQDLAVEYDLNFSVRPNTGLRGALLYGLDKVSTPYVAFVEHDWEFIRNIKFPELIGTFEHNSGINYVRFNKRENKATSDTIVKEKKFDSITLCETSEYSNNPHIARVQPYREWIESSNPDLEFIYNAFRIDGFKLMINNIFERLKETYIPELAIAWNNVERVLETKYKMRIIQEGFETAHSDMGMYLYGGKNQDPFIRHLGR